LLVKAGELLTAPTIGTFTSINPNVLVVSIMEEDVKGGM
jgi:hypothetical protein